MEGICLNCGLVLYGWALSNPNNQTCPKCGRVLNIEGASAGLEDYTHTTLPVEAETLLEKHLDEEKNVTTDS
jgi:hypothetical protein